MKKWPTPQINYWFLPHTDNNHRARIFHPRPLFLLALFLTIFNLTFQKISSSKPDILGFATDIRVDELVSLTNKKRQDTGLSALRFDAALSQAAIQKANYMFANNYWSHTSPDGKTPWDFIKGAGYDYLYAGENLAKDFGNSGGVVEAWMNSPTHRDNILNPEYQDIGFAVINGHLNGNETTLVVQMFGAKVEGSMVAQKTQNLILQPTKAIVQTVQPTTVIAEQEIKPSIIKTTIFPSPTHIPILTLLPTEAPRLIAKVQNEQNLMSPLFLSSMHKRPIIDKFNLKKAIFIFIILILIIVLLIDSIYIWKKKPIRFVGHNFAHLIFLVSFLVLLLISSTGKIL